MVKKKQQYVTTKLSHTCSTAQKLMHYYILIKIYVAHAAINAKLRGVNEHSKETSLNQLNLKPEMSMKFRNYQAL